MENASLRLQYKVGAFVGAGLILLMVSILVLGGDKAFLTRYVNLYANFNDVQGLFPGSVVSLAGLSVGNVKSIEFIPGDNKLKVEMKVARQFMGRIHQGTIAEIRTQGALGDKFIYLTPGPLNSPELKDGAQIEASEGGDLLSMLSSKEDGIGKVGDVLKEMHILLAGLNAEGRVTQTADNLKAMSSQMRQTMIKFDGLIGNLNTQVTDKKKLGRAVDSLANVMEKLDSGKGTLGALINDPSLHQSLKALVGGDSSRNKYMKGIVRESIQQSESKK